MENLITNSNNVNLFSLNDYSLEIIFQYLDLHQKIRLSLCHPRLERIFTDVISPRLQRNFYLEELSQFSTWELRQFFITMGIYMDKFVIGRKFPSYCSRMNICSLLQERSLCVKSVHIISWMPWQYNPFLNLLQLCYISELELYKCNLTEADLQHLLKLRNLKALGVAGNYHLYGTHLKHFRKLQRLSLCWCENITDDALFECCQYLQLTYLDIRLTNHTRLTGRALKMCKTLDTLKITRFFPTISKVPKLRSLEVYHTNSPVNTYI